MSAVASKTHRVEAIDFWRGLVLVGILCDHIPGNLIEKATPRNFGFSDSAEAFVFLSGFSVGIATVIAITFLTPLAFAWYVFVGTMVTLAVGSLVSSWAGAFTAARTTPTI